MTTSPVRRGRERATSRPDGVFSRHAFSAGAAYDPDNVAFGPLVALDEHVLAAGAGFADHRHAGIEIITWPLSGAVTHRSGDAESPVTPGTLQYLAAGGGVTHSETALGPAPARFLQMWLVGVADAPVRYERRDVPPGLGWRHLAASPDRRPEVVEPELGGIVLDRSGARLDLLRLRGGQAAQLPAAPGVLVHLVTGSVLLANGTVLEASDSIRWRSARSGDALRVRARRPAELLIWSFTDTG
ncbi:MAG: pirin family protein [bacterium]